MPLLSLALLTAGALAGSPAESCVSFEVRRVGPALAIAADTIPDGQTHVAPIGADGLVTVLVPTGLGRAGDLVRTHDGGMLIVRCDAGTLRILVKRGDAAPREVMARAMTDLRQLDMTVSITAWDGATARFGIRNWNRVVAEDGPIVDMFGGKIPLNNGDYSIATEIREAATHGAFLGEMRLEGSGGYWFVETRIGNGPPGTMLVDLAAGSSFVRADALPAGARIEPAMMRQRSAQGDSLVAAGVTGAGGDVAAALKVAHTTLAAGTVNWPTAELLVLDSLPSVGGKTITGILGIDLLGAAGLLRLVPPGATPGSIAVGGNPSTGDGVTLRRHGELLAVPVTIHGVTTWMVLDSGSPRTVLSRALASAAHLGKGPAPSRPPRGLDGRPLDAYTSSATAWTLGSWSLPPAEVLVADLPVLTGVTGPGELGGVIGADLLATLGPLELDLAGSVMRRVPR